MAKIKAGFRSKSGTTGAISARVIVHRTAHRGSAAFEACVRLGKSKLRGARDAECAYGRNPRAAIGNALGKLGKHVKSRKGAFRGYSR